MRLIYLHIILICMALAGCGHDSETQKKFAEIDRICEEDTATAMSMLKSIDYRTLSEKDRHRHDLLNIKTRDKAYKRHTSDSLVLDVIDYYSSHQDQGFYPEALYYGGRVYADMGDAEKAIAYFQDALDTIPDNKKYLPLKCHILSQTGRLLANRREPDEAIKYIEESIKLLTLLNDSSNITYDHIFLSELFLNTEDNQRAKFNISKAKDYSLSLPESVKVRIKVLSAELLNKEGKIDSALNIIRPLPEPIDSLCYYYTISKAAGIYLNAGILDTAYIYAKELAFCNNFEHQRIGFHILLLPEIRNLIPQDSIISYSIELSNAVEKYFKAYDSQQIMVQNAQYNYKTHVIEKEVTKKNLHNLTLISTIAIIILLGIIIILLYRKYKIAVEKSELMELIRNIQQGVDVSEGVNENDILNQPDKMLELKKSSFDAIKKNLDSKAEISIHQSIKDSPVYKRIYDKCLTRECIYDAENIWSQLEDLIESSSPGFHKRLMILTEGKITDAEMKVILLMRCGFKPSKIGVLMSRERSTISSHRKSISSKISTEINLMPRLDFIILSL